MEFLFLVKFTEKLTIQFFNFIYTSSHFIGDNKLVQVIFSLFFPHFIKFIIKQISRTTLIRIFYFFLYSGFLRHILGLLPHHFIRINKLKSFFSFKYFLLHYRTFLLLLKHSHSLQSIIYSTL